METLTVRDKGLKVLQQARAELASRGLYKGNYVDQSQPPETAPVCMLGAVNLAASGTFGYPFETGSPPERQVAIDRLTEALSGKSIQMFSDDPDTTLEDALVVLDRAIEG